MTRDEGTTPGPVGDRVGFLRRMLIVAAVATLALPLWQVRDALLLAFGGVVVAVLLLAMAEPLERRLGLSRPRALAAVGLAFALVLAGAALLVGGQVRAQAGQLGVRLPDAARAVERRLRGELPAVSRGVQRRAGGEAHPDGGQALADGVLRGSAAAGSAALGEASALALVAAGGAFLAADPRVYRRGLVKLLPRSQHAIAGGDPPEIPCSGSSR